MRIWWCNQSDQWHVERAHEVVCSHDSSLGGGNNTYRKMVGEVKLGDLIVHYSKPNVVAFSRALEDGRYYKRLPLLGHDDYGAGWRFKTAYLDLKNSIPRNSFGNRLIPLRVKHYPFDITPA